MGEEGRRLRLRQLTARRLAEDPVVYLADLPADEVSYFRQQRRFIGERLETLTGMPAEHRAEGSALLDHTVGDGTDLRFPTQQRDRQAALLLCAAWPSTTSSGRSRWGTRSWPPTRCCAPTLATGRSARRSSPAIALDQLAALDLLSEAEGALRLRPAAGRFRDAIGTVLAPSDAHDPQGSLL